MTCHAFPSKLHPLTTLHSVVSPSYGKDVENGAETPAGVVAQKIGTQVGVAGTFLQAKMGEGIRVVKEKSESARRGRWTPSNEVETLGADSSASNGAASSSHGENSKLRAMKALLSRIKKGAGSALGNWDAPESEDGSRKVPQYRKELLINEQFVKEIGSDGNFAKRLITKTLFKFGGKKWKKKLLTEKYLRKAAAIRKRRRDEDGIETHMDGDFTRHVSDDMPDDDYNDGRKGRRGKKGGNKKGQVEKATKIEKATNDFMGKERRIEAKGAVDDVQSGEQLVLSISALFWCMMFARWQTSGILTILAKHAIALFPASRTRCVSILSCLVFTGSVYYPSSW